MTTQVLENIKQFFAFCTERELIRQRRERGDPWPWTKEPILQTWFFCNIHREHDRTTVWFRENVRDPLDKAPGVRPHYITYATFLFRWFNRIETGERLLRHGYFTGPAVWDPRDVIRDLGDLKPIVTGAYMIKTPTGLDKLNGIVSCVQQTLDTDILERATDAGSLEACHSILQEAPFLGVFMAYEIVTDLRHTRVLRDAPDIMTWASPGPGCARGLDWTFGGRTRHYTNPTSRAQMIAEMQELLHYSTALWPEAWGRWEMRTVEHALCEYDKFMRAARGEPQKRRYRLERKS